MEMTLHNVRDWRIEPPDEEGRPAVLYIDSEDTNGEFRIALFPVRRAEVKPAPEPLVPRGSRTGAMRA